MIVAALLFGIFGNTLVIISILGQRRLIKNNYYFLILHLAICDLLWLLIITLTNVNFRFSKGSLISNSVLHCVVDEMSFVFQAAGIGMMLAVSVLRYRATVHPLKPAITRRKLKVVCGLVYMFGLIAGYGTAMPSCFMLANIVYEKFHLAYVITCFYSFPTMFMTVVYFRIARTLFKQNKYIKSICSSSARSSASKSSSFNIMKYLRNRRIFLVCLITVVCFGVGHVPFSVWFIWFISGKYHLMMKYTWLYDIAIILRLAGSHSVNPLIYGILDKKLLRFWKLCLKKKWRSQENEVVILPSLENDTAL